MKPKLEELRIQFMLTDTPIYTVASEVGHHPAILGQMLRGHTPMPEQTYQRVVDALARRRRPNGRANQT